MSLPALRDLFARHRAGATGLWRLGHEPGRTVYLEHGQVVFASSTHPLDRLTHLLVERGKLTQVQLDYAMANLNPTMSIGRNLIEMGFITQRDLLDVARAQVERVVWAAMAVEEDPPAFEAKALDAATVRLPFDTPAMLLAGVLNLQDRERLLAELGPLDQMVTLEGRVPADLNLPADLVRIPSLLGDHRTLLELSRESGVEPFRLGAFVLYLREMGWARLHGAAPPEPVLVLPLTDQPAPSVLPPPLPVPSVPSPLPQLSLIEEIQASQHPTTNLEHLAETLDQLGPEDEVDEPLPASRPFTPGEPALPILQAASGITETSELPDLEPKTSNRRPLALVLILLVSLGLWGGLRWHRKNPIILPRLTQSAPQEPKPSVPAPSPGPAPQTPQAPEVKAPPAAAPATPDPAPAPVPSQAVAPSPAPPRAQPKAEGKAAVPSKAERLKTIRDGNWKLALTQGAAHRATLRGRWSLRLEIACQGDTVQHAAGLLKGQEPDLFLLPITMRGGRTCYQIFLGSFESEAAAQAAARRLPAAFLAGGNRPKPFRADEIPSRQ